MPLTFPTSPTNGQTVTLSDDKEKFIASSPGQTDDATYYFKKV